MFPADNNMHFKTQVVNPEGITHSTDSTWHEHVFRWVSCDIVANLPFYFVMFCITFAGTLEWVLLNERIHAMLYMSNAWYLNSVSYLYDQHVLRFCHGM